MTSNNNNNNNNNLQIIQINDEEPKLSILLINEILKYCWNDRYAVYSWKVSLSLISKKVFKIISSFSTSINLVSVDLYQHLKNKHCLFKEIDTLTTSFKFLEGFIEEFHFEPLEKRNVYLPIDCSLDNEDDEKIPDPLALLSSLTIRGPAATYVKKEKLLLNLLLSSNQSTFKHFSMISHKNTLLKNIFTYLTQCPMLESFGLGLPMSDKKSGDLLQYLKSNGKNLKSLHLCFHMKSTPSQDDSKQLNETLFGIDSDIDLSSLQSLELGQKKLAGPNYDSHSFDYPILASDLLFKSISNNKGISGGPINVNCLKTFIFNKPNGYTYTPAQANEFLDNLNQYLQSTMSNPALTHLEIPVKINRIDVLSSIANKDSLRRITILTNQMCKFNQPFIDRLELQSDTQDKDTQEPTQQFFDMNSTLKIRKLVIRDHIFFESCKPLLNQESTLECLSIALKGKTNFALHNNPFLSIPDAKKLKKIVAKFPHLEKDDVADAISRFFRFCSMSDSIQYVKYIQSDFNFSKVNSFDFRFLNRNDRSYYYTRSLPKDEEKPLLICTDLKSWNGIDDQYDKFKSYVTKSRKLFDQLVEQCKSRPEYSAPYLLKYTKNCLTTFNREQWESSDDILKTAHSVVCSINDQDQFANYLVENAHMNPEFLKKTAYYLFYGLGPSAKPVPLEQLEESLKSNKDNKDYINEISY